ncbi:MobF family relaxase [Klenkia brasiliensis]|uniref:DNA primase, catalytic core n=1 Tax=Klenkia brasiliensis TaxID=333142 RepID=A0A1G7SAJ2_9ACTN|nr:MobF family relaxase [Klenkia brasiliensis]SDG19954.1 DNA primase, catalytic core [Klenkia brasiliensis]
MTVHKLTAGDGYTYLSRQVAAQDADGPGVGGLSAYYTAKGESPGRWLGRGLEALTGEGLGPRVTEAQMRALFGEGCHPDRDRIATELTSAGATAAEVGRATRLGAPYRVFAAAGEFRQRCAVAYREHNAAHEEARGTPVPQEDRARIRTAITVQMFSEAFGRAPLDVRELSGHMARISRQATTAVAGYDLTFSPVKSVSTLWAIAPPEIAAAIEQAHDDAVLDVINWLEDHATYTRTGRHGVAQVDVHGLLGAAFTHRDSRAGDPDLHTHVAISNKVQTLTGRWLALDGRPIYKNTVAASERYNTRIEALLTERLGVRFAERRDGNTNKRPIREIVGIDGSLPRMWSSRRAAIDTRRAVLTATFQFDHGRPPTVREAIQLAQQANLETRDVKHEPRSHAEQRATWRAEALTVLGDADGLTRYVDGALNPVHRPAPPAITDQWLHDVARATVDRVALARATWEEPHLRAEAERRARHAGVPYVELDTAVDRVVTRALSPPFSLRITPDRDDGEPDPLRRLDGTSVFDVDGATVHTSDQVLDAERLIIDAAGRFDGHVTPTHSVHEALEKASAIGPPLNPGQTDFVRQLATSGSRVQAALAPAGTGKTTALGVLAEAWRAGGGTVIGLAPSAAASAVLRHKLADTTDTVAKFVHSMRTGADTPDWMASLGPGSLVIVDEAGAAATGDLAAVVDAVVTAGGSVRLVGDDQQLGAIGAGGLLTDLALTYGAVHLTEVVRFTHRDTGAPNAVEGAVSLALRDGDPAALAYYADRGRFHVGDLATCLDQAFGAWQADRAAGLDALMLAPTRDVVRELNDRARAERLDREGRGGPEVAFADGTAGSVGDVVITRRNDRTLASGRAGWVTNGDRWTIAAVRLSGAIDVVHNQTAALVTLPPDYVRADVTLGYASTVHGAQGVTADASHTVVTGTESRQQLYVALTRGRHANHAFITVAGDGDTHSAITRDGVLPPTAVEILQRILARDSAPQSANSALAQANNPAQLLAAEVDRYVHSLATAAEDLVGADVMATIDEAAEAAFSGLPDEPAYPALRADLALQAAAGYDAIEVLRSAVNDPRGLHNARDVAAVLDWRIKAPEPDGPPPPLPWLHATPQALADHPVWGSYLARRADCIRERTTTISDAAADWTPDSAPAWSQPLIGAPELIRELAVWRAAGGTEPSDPRPTGAPSFTAADLAHQRRLDTRVRQILSATTTEAVQWAAQLRDAAPGIDTDPYWPVLLDRLVSSRLADPDGTGLLEAATTTPLPDELPAAALWWRLLEHLPAHDGQDTGMGARVNLTPPPAPAPGGSLHDADEAARRRALELNELAAAFFDDAYGGSWAQTYLVDRLGTDPRESTNYTVGYAPGGWTQLVDHLRGAGVSEDDLLASGLASRTSNGRLIDRFRDRVVFAIRDDVGIVGWIGRRHPDADMAPHPGSPKYLNTAETLAFVKGRHLFGLAENRPTVRHGATPVLVEGPVDALAVTIAGAGNFIGIAPLGTAFTDEQADRLMVSVQDGAPSVIVGMDSDPAGRRSSEGIFWKLIDRAEVRSLALTEGSDPADTIRDRGTAALASALESHVGLADVVVDARINEVADRLDTVEGQVAATRRSAEVIASVPVPQWPALLTHVVARTGIAPDIALAETLAAADRRTHAVSRSDLAVNVSEDRYEIAQAQAQKRWSRTCGPGLLEPARHRSR